MREELRRRLETNADADGGSVVSEISDYLAGKPQLKTVATYAALPGEVDLCELPEKVERIWVFPKVVGEEMVFYRVNCFEEDMTRGSFGIMEPNENLQKIDVSRIDLFLCPGLGFDLKGGRIGRGKGFYDKMLSRARPDAVKFGICFGYQIVNEVAMDDHDVRMNRVIVG